MLCYVSFVYYLEFSTKYRALYLRQYILDIINNLSEKIEYIQASQATQGNIFLKHFEQNRRQVSLKEN